MPTKHKQENSKERNKLKTVSAVRATWLTITMTAPFYPVSFFFFIISLSATSALQVRQENWWVGFLDFLNIFGGTAISAYVIAMTVVWIIGIISFLIANIMFFSAFINPYERGVSLIIAAFCLALSAIPIFAIIPWIWVWCLYVVKSQKTDASDAV